MGVMTRVMVTRWLALACVGAPLLLGATMCGEAESERAEVEPETDNAMKDTKEAVEQQLEVREEHLEESLERSLNEPGHEEAN